MRGRGERSGEMVGEARRPPTSLPFYNKITVPMPALCRPQSCLHGRSACQRVRDGQGSGEARRRPKHAISAWRIVRAGELAARRRAFEAGEQEVRLEVELSDAQSMSSRQEGLVMVR